MKEIRTPLFADITEIPQPLSSSYYSFLDGMRAVAIASVVACHVLRDSPLLRFIDGGVGVDVFFILSGFLITTLLLKEKVKFGSVSYKNFYIRRALRIFPVAYLFLIVLIILNVVFSLKITTNQFLASWLYIKNFQWPTDWYSAHFWSLSIEEQFYFLMPVVLIRNTNLYMVTCFLLIIVTPVLSYLVFHNLGVFYTNKPVHLVLLGLLSVLNRGGAYLLAGSLLSIMMFKRVIKPEGLRLSKHLATILFLMALIIHFLNIPYASGVCFSVLMCLVIAINLAGQNSLTRILSIPLLVNIGILSYSIYIWQQLFTVYQPWEKAFPFGGSPLFNLPLLLLIAWLSYTFYESYFLKLKGRYTKLPDAEGTGRVF